MPDAFALRPGRPDDAGWMVELRAEAMQPDLERLGRWDPARARQRFLDGYVLVVRGSAARRLYERHGFVHLSDHENGIDQILGR